MRIVVDGRPRFLAGTFYIPQLGSFELTIEDASFSFRRKEAALASRESPVAKAPRSEKAEAKDAGKRTEDGQPVHSFHTLIADLGTLRLNEAAAAGGSNYTLTMPTRPTPLQQKALDLLGVSLTERG